MQVRGLWTRVDEVPDSACVSHDPVCAHSLLGKTWANGSSVCNPGGPRCRYLYLIAGGSGRWSPLCVVPGVSICVCSSSQLSRTWADVVAEDPNCACMCVCMNVAILSSLLICLLFIYSACIALLDVLVRGRGGGGGLTRDIA